jgi:A/G-specific adenine glycosylase
MVLDCKDVKAVALFQRRLLSWYQRHKRDLPWRRSRDPYRVWLSEIMLQQTRVAAVIGYYRRFLEQFPTVQDLAAATEGQVLAAWSGLGYYRRARMLHAAAKQVATESRGCFPSTAAGLEKLPGIGRYTSSAIASIAFGEATAVVDGNVERVLQRIFNDPLAGEKVWRTASALLPRGRPGDFNQAMMELGATVCVPKAPACMVCPVVDFCRTRGAGVAKQKELRRKREIHYGFNSRPKSVFLVRRAADESLMPGMWELPEIEPNGHPCWLTLRHSITVTDYTVRVVKDVDPPGGGRWVANARMNSLPLTGLTRKILKAAGVL